MTTEAQPRVTGTGEALAERIFGAAVQSLELFSADVCPRTLPIENDFFRFYRMRV